MRVVNDKGWVLAFWFNELAYKFVQESGSGAWIGTLDILFLAEIVNEYVGFL